MNNDKSALANLIEEFDDIFSQNKYWYSIIKETMFDVAVDAISINDLKKFKVIILEEDFNKFYKKHHKRIATSWTQDHKGLSYLFFNKNKDAYVEVFLVVPTNIKKVKKMHGFINKLNYSFYIKNKKLDVKWKVIKFVLYLSKMFMHYKNTKDEYNSLIEIKNKGFCILSSPFEGAEQNWIPNLSFKNDRLKISDTSLSIAKEWKDIIYSQYGMIIVNKK